MYEEMKDKELHSGMGPHHHMKSPICFKAIFLGALAAIGLSFLLNLFNTGIGLTAYHYQNGDMTVAVGGLMWLVICAFVSMFIIGYIASSVSLTCCHKNGMLHGFAAWCLGLILLLVFMIPIAAIANDTNVGIIISQPLVSFLTTPLDSTNSVATTAAGSLALFFIFLVGAIAACLGGCLGAKRNSTRNNHCAR